MPSDTAPHFRQTELKAAASVPGRLTPQREWAGTEYRGMEGAIAQSAGICAVTRMQSARGNG
ncbi:hypothetical protein CF70_033700 [Cupriavidus sp. SK-3]|nr:hypothetical protein CF70_033700 [Cupriavidus sp. SK-3]